VALVATDALHYRPRSTRFEPVPDSRGSTTGFWTRTPLRGREHPGQLCELQVQAFEVPGIDRRQVVVQRVDVHPEGLPVLELGGPPADPEVMGPLGLRAQFGGEAVLADARLPGDLDNPRGARLQVDQCPLQDVEFGAPPDKVARALGHTASVVPGRTPRCVPAGESSHVICQPP
jgi:hypothetical protein